MKREWRDYIILGLAAILSTFAVWVAVGMQTIYENFDGPYYMVIAKCWYDPMCIGQTFSIPLPLEYYPAHFPLYPALINLAALTGVTRLQAMVGVNLLAAIGSALVIYKLVKSLKLGNPVWIGLASLFLWPRMWAVRSVGSPESLLIVLVLGSIYWFIKKKYWLAAMVGCAAVLSKPPGILLLVGYAAWWLFEGLKHRRWHWQVWPISLMAVTLVGLFGYYHMQTGDFLAYFHSGDNIHLQFLPFQVFNSGQSWVGTFWLEDVLWIYLVGGIGILRVFSKSTVLGWFGAVFFATILFVSHRDIARYSLPIVPVVLIGLSEVLDRREVRWVLAAMIVPLFVYTVNFLGQNTTGIPTWQPYL